MILTVYDYLYALVGIIFGIIMIINPRMLMRNAGYDEESLKTESFMKKIGVLLIIASIGLAIYLYIKLNA